MTHQRFSWIRSPLLSFLSTSVEGLVDNSLVALVATRHGLEWQGLLQDKIFDLSNKTFNTLWICLCRVLVSRRPDAKSFV